jgi:S-DNA-T family DNA segregation ATPase FtsK/SpoIIIE
VKVKKVQKKRYKKKEIRKGNNREIKGNYREIKGILILSFGILSFLSLFFSETVGLFGEIIQKLLLGFMGLPGYIIPFVIIAWGVFIIFKKDGTIFKTRLRYFLILLLLQLESFSGFPPVFLHLQLHLALLFLHLFSLLRLYLIIPMEGSCI